MAESTVVYTPENNGGSVPAWLAMNNGGLGNGLGGWGGGILGFLLGLWFGNGNLGGIGGDNNANANAQREMLNNAIMSQGEASRSAVQNLSTMLGQDFNLVNSNVNAIRDGIAALTAQTGMSALQIQNAVQAGNATLASQLCQCCCENRLLTTQQGYESQIRTLEQTNMLGSQADRNTRSITDAIAAQTVAMNDGFCAIKERELQGEINRQAEIITQLRGQIDNANQTAAISSYVNGLVAPISAKVTEIASKMPNTVPVQWPNLAAVNTTPYVSGGYYQGGFNGYYGGGVPGFNGGFNF